MKSVDASGEGTAGVRTGGDEVPDNNTAERTQTEIGEGQGPFPAQARERQQQGQGRSWRRNSTKHQQKIATQRDNKEQANREWSQGPKWTVWGGRHELAVWGLSDIPSDESEPEEDQGMGDITVAHDGNQQKHSFERLEDEIESLGRQALLQRNSHIPRQFVNVGRNYMNHALRGYDEFDSWESESSKHKSGIKDRVSEFVLVKHAYAHMGLPFEHSRQGKVGFHDLD